MGAFWKLPFGKPNVDKLKKKKNVDELVKLLIYEKNSVIREKAAEALKEIGWEPSATEEKVSELIATQSWRERKDVDVESLIHKLGSHKSEEVLEAIDKLKACDNSKAVLPLINKAKSSFEHVGYDYIKDFDSEKIFISAVGALGHIGDKRAVDYLKDVMKNPEREDLKLIVKGALAKIRDPEAVDVLIGTLEDRDPDLREGAIRALVQVTRSWMKVGALNQEIINAILRTLNDSDERVRKEAVESLGEISKMGKTFFTDELSNRLEKHLKPLLKDGSTVVRESTHRVWTSITERKDASYYIAAKNWNKLEELGDQVVEALINTLKTDYFDIETRANVSAVLGEIGRKTSSETIGSRIFEALSEALSDEHAKIRESAIDALTQIKGFQVFDHIVKCLDDSELDVRKKAAEALGSISSERATEHLINTLRDGEPEVREAALGALVNIGKASVDSLITVLQDKNFNVCEAAARALGRIGDTRVIQPLLGVLSHHRSEVRENVAKALDKLGWRSKTEKESIAYLLASRKWHELAKIAGPAVDSLISVLKDGDPDIRQKVTETLGKIRDPNSVEALMRGLTDPDKRVRKEAAQALGHIQDTRAVDFLHERLQREEFFDVRDAIEGALKKMGWTPKIEKRKST